MFGRFVPRSGRVADFLLPPSQRRAFSIFSLRLVNFKEHKLQNNLTPSEESKTVSEIKSKGLIDRLERSESDLLKQLASNPDEFGTIEGSYI